MDSAEKADFTALYDGCAKWLYSYLFSLLRHHEDAHEVLQDTARTLWEKFDQYHRGTEFRAWACRIAYYKAQNFRRRSRTQPSSFSDLFFDVADEEAIVMTDRLDARSAALSKCLEKLPAADRILLEKRHAQEWDVAAMARAMGRSPQTIYRSLSRIYSMLFDCVTATVDEELAS